MENKTLQPVAGGQMKVSVIITTYNRPDALRKVLEGMAHQTRFPHETVIADDGSGPETASMLEEFQQNAPFTLLHIHQEDRGFRAARIRNRAVLASAGDYIVFLDGDCIPEPHFIEDHQRLAEPGFFFQGKRVLVGQGLSPRFQIPPGKNQWTYLFHKEIGNRHHLFRMPFFPAAASKGMSGIRSCNMGLFRDDLFRVNGFNEAFTGWGREDSELAVRLYKLGLRRKNHPFMATCFHLWHPENDRDRLSFNDQLLQQAMESDTYECTQGLVQK